MDRFDKKLFDLYAKDYLKNWLLDQRIKLRTEETELEAVEGGNILYYDELEEISNSIKFLSKKN